MAAKQLDPIHPGGSQQRSWSILSEEFMVPMESSKAIACAIGVTPARVNEIVNGRSRLRATSISADTALRLGRYFGTTADVWINLQKRYELEIARRELGKALAQIQPRAA